MLFSVNAAFLVILYIFIGNLSLTQYLFLFIEIPVHQPPLPQMALQDQHEIQAINQIAESLDSGERRVIFYLCESFDTDNSVTCMKDMLKHKVTSHDTSDLFLTELMWQLRRYDILRKVFQTSREEVARILKYRHVLSRFR